MVNRKRPPFWHITVKQLLVLLPLGAVLGVVDITLAVSVVCGGMIAIIPHLYFTAYAFRYRGSSSATQVTRSFYRGETGKFVLTLVGFACVFGFVHQVRGAAVFAGYLLMWLLQIFWVAAATRDL